MRQIAVLALALAASISHAQPTARTVAPGDAGLLAGLIGTPAVSGFEADVRTLLAQGRTTGRRVDEAGNLIVTFGQGKPHLLVCADLDEDGYFVSGITDDGYLRVHRVTTGVTNRLFEQMHYGQPMFVRTSTGTRVPGVFVTASTHLQRGRTQDSAPKSLDDLWVDVGADTKAGAEKLGISVLDPVSLRERVQRLAGDRIAGVAAQTRAGDLALDMLVAAYDKREPKVAGSITIAWAAQGSFGERGMARLAQEIDADRIVVVARTPMPRDGNNPKGAIGQLGGGVLVADTDAKMIEQAKQAGVAVQPIAGALRAPNVWPAAKAQVIALPVLYAQTPVETVDQRDVAALADLLRAVTGLTERVTVARGVLGATSATLPDVPPNTIDILRPLVSVTGVSGAETPVRELIARQLPKWANPQVDERGNLTVTFGPRRSSGETTPREGGGKELVFVAHMDEIGYEITNILPDGTASVVKRGGFFDYLWEAHPVFVQTPKGAVPAIVAPRPGYLNASTAAPRADEIVLYFGTASAAETGSLGVSKGTTATIRKELTQLAGSRWTARSMDDRCGVAALVAALNRIDPAKVSNRVTFAFVVGEETGLVGSGFLAQRARPAYAFAIDTFVSSDSPVDPQRMALVPLGSGVVARAIDNSSITPPEAVARVVAVGRTRKIPVIPSATSGGNDGSQFSRYGSTVVPLSWPGRYSHSPVEVMDLRDLENLVGLIVALASEIK
jgi:putative aminopeptidase FrvX